MASWRSTLATFVMASVVGWGTALSAQETQPRGQGMHGGQGMMPGMGLMQAFAPAKLLEQRDALGLTDEQVARLTEIRQEIDNVRDGALATHETHRAKLGEALMVPRPDPTTVRTHFDAAHAAMGHAHWLGIDAAIRAMKVLTEEQRNQVRSGIGQQDMGSAMPGGCCMQGRGGEVQGGDPGMRSCCRPGQRRAGAGCCRGRR